MKKIIFWGDSITDGGRLKGKEHAWDLNHQIGHCYAYLLSAEMGLRYPERDYIFLDRGVSGFRTADLCEHLREDILEEKPDCVSILVGINDCLHTIDGKPGSDPESYEANYRHILQELCRENPEISLVLCEPFCLPVGIVKNSLAQFTETIRPLQEIAARLASEFGAIFVPLQKPFSDACALREPSYWSWDGIHPTVSGHALLAREWKKAAEKLFQ